MNGCYVQVHYTGTLENGEIFDSTSASTPVEVKMGEGQFIEGFESALMDMAVNEKKTITLPPEKAYGMRDETLERTFMRSQLPADLNPAKGDTLALSSAEGQTIPVLVKVSDPEKIVVDLNHPLAGRILTFDIEIAGITEHPTQAGCGCGCDCSSSSPQNDSSCGGCGSPGNCR
jgi:peptidylprolyl isomerase